MVVNSIGQLGQGANYWFAASNFCGGVSLVLHSFPPSDVFLTIIISNLLLFVELCFLNKAIAEFVERGRHLWLGLLGLSVVATIVTFYAGRQHPIPGLVMEFISVIAISTATCSAVLLFRYPPPGSKIPTLVMGTLFSLYVVNNLVRSLTGYASLRFYHIWIDRTTIAGLSFGFLWMTAARLRNSLQHLASTDALTGTLNRHRIEEAMKGMLAWNRRNDLYVAVLLIDLDRFKGINDNLGHCIGDQVLKALAGRLNSAVRQEDMVGRLGGDEFVILQAGISQPESAEFLTRRVIEILREPYDINGLKVICNVSIGVAIAPGDAQQFDALFSCADAALYKAKAEGRNTVCFYEAGMEANLRERQQLERELRRALDLKAFQLAYQPLVTLHDGNLIGFEALLRWPEGWDPQSPAAFIPVAESYGLIVPLGAWVLGTACATAASWKQPLKLAVNLSPVQFSQGDIVADVTSALKSSGLDPARLELEVTESLWLQDTDTLAVNDVGAAGSICESQLLENEHIVRKLECIVLFEFALTFVSLKARAGLDVARYVPPTGPFQEIRFSNQITGRNASAINERLVTSHGGQGFSFAIGQVNRLHGCGDLKHFSNCILMHDALFPEEFHKGRGFIPLGCISECIHGYSVRTMNEVIKLRG
jgi:diguanylate cyclase (GGDEF)-like protein